MTAPPDDTTEGKAPPETMLQPCSFDDSPEPTTAPVTAEDARERVAAAIEARIKASVLPERPPYDGSIGLAHFVGASFHDLADVALAALAGDPGDLPARMAEAMREAIDYELTTGGESGLRELVASLDDPSSSALVAASMSVRWEHAARQAAEVERLRAELETAHEERDAARLVSKGRTMEQYDAIERAEKAEAERDALQVKVTRQRDVNRIVAGERDALKAAIECAQAKLDELNGGTSIAVSLELLDPPDLTVVRHVTSTIRAALAVPESTESAEGATDES